MSSHLIYEDQENRIPAAQRRVKPQDPRLTNASNAQDNSSNSRCILAPINPNLRRQPTRAAKQGVSYETGVPQQDENVCPNQKSFSTSQPSFTIHEDSSSCLSMGSTNSSTANASIKSTRPPLRERSIRSAKRSAEPKLKIEDIGPSIMKLERSSETEASGSPATMEVSLCEDDLMVVETSPREDVLKKRSEDIYDVPEYAEDIYKYLRQAEVFHKPRVNYMAKQTDITASMRWILVDWLVEVAEEYTLHTETLYLAVSYIDRFLSHMSVKKDKLQLVGTTAMFIAAKYEEIYPPDVSQFAYITDNTYKVGQILRMEHLILKVLSFDMAVPTANVFVNKFARMCKAPEETLHLALFLAEITMLDCDPFLRYLPSMIAASSVALANHTQGRLAWPPHVEESSGYSLQDLKECYVNIHRTFSRVHESQQHAIRDKYKSSKWHSVSQLSPRLNFPW
ncbi:G2/mitotic-specific cyclin-A [Macrobrachium rosenbergii]|uniref:G2/mitotic-specific cyclin-A n=1 Tax=Macrobrachium rosenbergii TaxID=79674 RepID=UPI0034D6D3E7